MQREGGDEVFRAMTCIERGKGAPEILISHDKCVTHTSQTSVTKTLVNRSSKSAKSKEDTVQVRFSSSPVHLPQYTSGNISTSANGNHECWLETIQHLVRRFLTELVDLIGRVSD